MDNDAHDADPSSRVGEEITGTPRWVKVFGAVLLVIVLAFIILMFSRGPGGRGEHTPFRHFGSHGDR